MELFPSLVILRWEAATKIFFLGGHGSGNALLQRGQADREGAPIR
jgi:hypothetical protein